MHFPVSATGSQTHSQSDNRQLFRKLSCQTDDHARVTSVGFISRENWSHIFSNGGAEARNDWSCWHGTVRTEYQIFWWRAIVVWTRCDVDGHEYHFRTVLHDLIECLYPDTVDADVVASQFNAVRRLQAWTDAPHYSSVLWVVQQALSNYEKCIASW